jgi:hypothetical protein
MTENVKHVDPAQAIAGVAAELRYADGMQSSRHREWADRLQAAIAALQREADDGATLGCDLTLSGLIIYGRIAANPSQGATPAHLRDLIRQMLPHLERYGEFATTPASAEPGEYPDEAAKARMVHDFPKLMDFFTRYAFAPKLAPSCLVCGVSIQGREVGVTHMDLPGIVVCMQCRNKATASPEARGGGEAYPTGSDREVLLYLMQQFDAESWECRCCGHSEDCATMDSAIYLREYLASHPAPAALDAPAEQADVYRSAWEHLCENSYDHNKPRMICIPTSEWKAAEKMIDARATTGASE